MDIYETIRKYKVEQTKAEDEVFRKNTDLYNRTRKLAKELENAGCTVPVRFLPDPESTFHHTAYLKIERGCIEFYIRDSTGSTCSGMYRIDLIAPLASYKYDEAVRHLTAMGALEDVV